MVTVQSSSTMASLTRLLHHHTTQTHRPSITIVSAVSMPTLTPHSPNKRRLIKEQNLLSSSSSNNTIFIKKNTNITTLPFLENTTTTTTRRSSDEEDTATNMLINKLHVVLEAVLDRIEMHHNVGEQRENWNELLLSSLNMVTLTAATMAGVASMGGAGGSALLALKISSFLLFSAATGILMIMNKIQPSQLVEEQRTAVRLLKQLRTKIQTTLSLQTVTENDVEEAMDKVLGLDRAYPLPLLGAMLDKFPETFKPAKWWRKKSSSKSSVAYRTSFKTRSSKNNNGWSQELEDQMSEIVSVTQRRDIQDFVRLGNKALKFNKMLAKTGPTLMGVGAMASAFAGHGGPWPGLVAAAAGSMASVVNTIQHGGQVGMVFEMYRNCAGFFDHLEESVETNLEEQDLEKRENGELFEMKMALKLGRSLSDLREFAAESSCSWLSEQGSPIGEFASKLF